MWNARRFQSCLLSPCENYKARCEDIHMKINFTHNVHFNLTQMFF